ncbi:hypothetical protein H310_02434 [Aphanomyces invadans]|uniref:Uncharacterized protein n=1 Tax=Aphanomyces invadans TaxID=157072 RepID=A0A024UR27_9STRA|nr:hypothetical protein H310_02434 [Aphanomyces invadans]ETW08068.1 hypothetical protein H310_02434 [Aphanomyces invadans]|eukprot:XP_008864161.1 hypothetical protein H310_02434 [Aphanomyces invadans]
MGASASVKYRQLDDKYHVQEKLQTIETKCMVLLHDAARRRDLTRHQLRVLVAELKAKEVQFEQLAHEKILPILMALQPYYDKYQPIVKKYAAVGVRHTKRLVRTVDDVVTTTTLQALYQARRQVVSQLSVATISAYFDIPLTDVIRLNVSKRRYTVQNCGPDLRHQEIEWTCEITDPTLIEKLFKLQWVPWKPTASTAVKLTETYMLDVQYYARNEYSIKVAHHTQLRAGRKWIALDSRHDNVSAPIKWLQRVDYKEREKRSTLFYDLISQIYSDMRREYLCSLDREDEARAAAAAAARPPPPKLTVFTPELIKRTLATLADKFMEEDRFLFYTLGEYECWRMEGEDLKQRGDLTIGEMYELFEMEKQDDRQRAFAMELVELGERVAMEVEDVNRGESKHERECGMMHRHDINVESDDEDG